MNAILLLIICIPLIEIYLLIKVGGMIGAFNTIFLIFFTAITGVYFARLAGLNAIRSGFNQLIKNEVPVYEIISGAALAFAALLLIIPGFLTDLIGFLLIIPVTRKFFISSISFKLKKKNINNNEDIIEGSVDENQQNKDE
jgi:Protein affecting phage T7 exclusion by the F plasmid